MWRSVGRLVALWLGVVFRSPPKISWLLPFFGVRGSASLPHRVVPGEVGGVSSFTLNLGSGQVRSGCCGW